MQVKWSFQQSGNHLHQAELKSPWGQNLEISFNNKYMIYMAGKCIFYPRKWIISYRIRSGINKGSLMINTYLVVPVDVL
jgi:hypothetical protein